MKLKTKNVVMKNDIKIKSKYRHECQHCSRQHSTKIELNKVIEQKNRNTK